MFRNQLLSYKFDLFKISERQKWLNRYIPFDASFDFHRIAAYTGIVLSVVHVIGHILNFRNLARQSSAVLACLVPSLIADDGSESRMTFPQLWFHHKKPSQLRGLRHMI